MDLKSTSKSLYDVVILGGGLAGLTLALQLKKSKPNISIAVIEKRAVKAPATAFKIGESSSELGSFYLLNKLEIKPYLDKKHLTKLGTRFFLSPEIPKDISNRVEISPEIDRLQQTMHIDRGVLENDLSEMMDEFGITLMLDAKVHEVSINANGHKVFAQKAEEKFELQTKWVVDASGRNGLLKKQLKLEKKSDHIINSAWFRLSSKVDIDSWTNSTAWQNQISTGLRRLSTNHLIGKGYWIWLIPLANDKTSIGIVADPDYHDFNQFNTLEKAMNWLKEYEPQAFEQLQSIRENVLDFKVMKEFAHDCKQFYSANRWALTGDAGAFLDPLYSPGLDFIALGNTWISDLILRDLNRESIVMRSMIYELTHRELFNGWQKVYQNMYGVFHKTQLMIMKICWDWGTYWSIPNVMFMNDGYTDLEVIKQYSSQAGRIGGRFSAINESMQQLFLDWSKHEAEPLNDVYFNIFSIQCLYDFQTQIADAYHGDKLVKKIASNLDVLEQLAAEIFRYAINQVQNTKIEFDINPYEMKLTDSLEVLVEKSKNMETIKVSDAIKRDVAKMWFGEKLVTA